MTGALAELGFLIAAWLSFAAVTSLAVALTWRVWARRARRAHPERRAGVAWAAAVAPSVVPTLLVLVCLAPGLAGLLGGRGDHCLRHAEHPHLCVIHFPAALRAPVVAVLVCGGGALAVALLRGAARLARNRQSVAALRSAARHEADLDANVVPSEQPFSFASGVARREVWISSTLADALSAEELEVVLMHERAHLERRDPVRHAAAAMLSFPLWPGVRGVVLRELALASEQACDEAAGRRVGDRLRVAETILGVERLAGARAPAAVSGLPAFGGSNVAERVQSLLHEAPSRHSAAPASWAAIGLASASLWLSADALHHAMEHWLRVLLSFG